MGFLTGAIDTAPELTKDVDLGNGFVVVLNWLSPSQRDEVQQASAELGRRGRLEINRDKHAKAYCRRVFRGWRGLTEEVFYDDLKIYIKKGMQEQVDAGFKEGKGQLPYSLEDCIFVYLNALPLKFADPIREALMEMDEEDRADRKRVNSKSR